MKRTENSEARSRDELKKAHRVVIKVGSRVLVGASGQPLPKRLEQITEQVSGLMADNRSPVLVSSGAIGMGVQALGRKTRPATLPDLQMAAAIGQTRLMNEYAGRFGAHGIHVAQVLLTHDGLKQRTRHLNARNTMLNLLRHQVLPVVNENDAVAVDDIQFGDNDILAALVSILVDADMLILLTTVNGLRDLSGSRSRRISQLDYITQDTLNLTNGKGHHLSTGGMASKLQAAQTAAKAGVHVVIADGRKADALTRILAGADVGTWIPAARGGLSGRKRWIAFFHRAQGSLVVDAGARRALEELGRSLLPIGIKKSEGTFQVGAVVNIRTGDGPVFARGLTEYASRDIELIKGKRTADIKSILGTTFYDEVIHRDNMVLLNPRKGEIT